MQPLKNEFDISPNQQQGWNIYFDVEFLFQDVFIFKSVHELCPIGFLNTLVIIIR